MSDDRVREQPPNETSPNMSGAGRWQPGSEAPPGMSGEYESGSEGLDGFRAGAADERARILAAVHQVLDREIRWQQEQVYRLGLTHPLVGHIYCRDRLIIVQDSIKVLTDEADQ